MRSGRVLATASDDETAAVWALPRRPGAAWRPLARLVKHGDPVLRCIWGPPGALGRFGRGTGLERPLVTCGADGWARVWDPEGWGIHHFDDDCDDIEVDEHRWLRLPLPTTSPVFSLGPHPAEVYGAELGVVGATSDAAAPPPGCVATAAATGLWLWDAGAPGGTPVLLASGWGGTGLAESSGHRGAPGYVFGVAAGPAAGPGAAPAALLAAPCSDGAVRVWDVASAGTSAGLGGWAPQFQLHGAHPHGVMTVWSSWSTGSGGGGGNRAPSAGPAVLSVGSDGSVGAYDLRVAAADGSPRALMWSLPSASDEFRVNGAALDSGGLVLACDDGMLRWVPLPGLGAAAKGGAGTEGGVAPEAWTGVAWCVPEWTDPPPLLCCALSDCGRVAAAGAKAAPRARGWTDAQLVEALGPRAGRRGCAGEGHDHHGHNGSACRDADEDPWDRERASIGGMASWGA